MDDFIADNNKSIEMASILDLPDECLITICKMLQREEQLYCWRNVCKRFEHIYFQYFHNWMEVNDNLAKNYGHLIGTDDFPLRIIKKLNLSMSNCTKYFLNKLRDCHTEIEEATLVSFTDEYLAELLPLPNLKKLICLSLNKLKGRSLIELDSLTELQIHTENSFDPKYLLQITYNNPLRKLVMPTEPYMFSNRYAFEMIENLKNVEELEISFNHCKSWQLIGTLPKLKKLDAKKFKSDECETCLGDNNLYQTCVGQHAAFFFDELRRRNQLEELILFGGNVSEHHVLRVSELTNLKYLSFCGTDFKCSLSLDVFKDLVHLEVLNLDGCRQINAVDSLELIRCCKKLTVLLLWFVDGVTPYFLTEANDILSRRQPAPLQPLLIGFSKFVEDLKLIQFEKPLPLLRFVKLMKRFVKVEVDKVRREEEDDVGQKAFSGPPMEKYFLYKNMDAGREEFQITVKSAKTDNTTRSGDKL